jgi:hypothetical protein
MGNLTKSELKDFFIQYMHECHFKVEDRITLQDLEKLKFEFSGGYPMILRDLLFYLVGYIFGVKGMTTHESIDLYKRI